MQKIHFSLIDKLLSIGASLLVCGAIFGLSFKILEAQFEQHLANQTQSAIKHIDTIVVDVMSSLQTLNQFDINRCDESALLQMRKQLFFSNFIKDIGFFKQDDLVCTTGLGPLPEPIYDMNPDFSSDTGVMVWVNRKVLLFQHNLSATIIRFGQFNAVIKQGSVANLIQNNRHWELVFAHGAMRSHIAGQKDTYKMAENQQNPMPYTAQQCSSEHPFCIIIGASSSQFWLENHLSLTIVAIICALFSLLCFFITLQLLRRYKSIESRLLRGLKREAFYCLYQPIVELQSGKIVGCEVLARYRDSEGNIYPDNFIPLISRLHRTWPFTKSIVQRALHEIKHNAQFSKRFKVNVNFFAQDISSSKILDILQFPKQDFTGIQFVIEVTEDEKLNTGTASEVLAKLVQKGFQVAVDDFGTGYSNLSQIRDLHCDSLKIDRSFISEMEGGSIRSTLIPHIVDIAHQVNVDIVAEGIENAHQYRALLELGVKYGQGYLFGKPMTLDELNALLPKHFSPLAPPKNQE